MRLLSALAFALLFGSALSQPVTRLWLKTTSRAGTDSYNDLAVDGTGNAYVGGTSSNAVTNLYEIDAVKYDKNGNKVWERFYPASSGHAAGRAVAFDAAGDMYVAGQTDWNPPGDGKARLIKISPAGTVIFDIVSSDSATDWADVAVDSGGEATAVGYVGSGAAKKMRTQHFLANGTLAWTRDYAYPGLAAIDQSLKYVEVDSERNIYVCGVNNAYPTATYNTIAKYSRTASLLWMRHFSNPLGFDYPRGFVLDPAGNPNVCFESRLHSSHYDGFSVVRYDPSGTQKFLKTAQGYVDAISISGFGVNRSGKTVATGFRIYQGVTTPFVSVVSPVATVEYPLPSGMETRSLACAPDTGDVYLGENLTGAGARPTTILGLVGDHTIGYDLLSNWSQTIYGSTAGGQTPFALTSKMVIDNLGDLYVTVNSSGAQGQDAYLFKYETGPTALNDAFGVQTGGTFNSAAGAVMANDSQCSQATVSLVDSTTHGTLTLQQDGTFTYVPDAGFAGKDHFRYRLTRTNSVLPRTGEGVAEITVWPNITDILVTPSIISGGHTAALVMSVSPVCHDDIYMGLFLQGPIGTADNPTIPAGHSIGGAGLWTSPVTSSTPATLRVTSGTDVRTVSVTIIP